MGAHKHSPARVFSVTAHASGGGATAATGTGALSLHLVAGALVGALLTLMLQSMLPPTQPRWATGKWGLRVLLAGFLRHVPRSAAVSRRR